MAPSTLSKYQPAWEKWCRWSTDHAFQNRPAKPYEVALYINYIFHIYHKQGTVKSAYYGIRWGHHVAGFTSPTDDPLVHLAYEGAVRLSPRHRNQKEPLPVDILKQVISAYGLNNSNLMDFRFTIVCLIGFAGFFRIDELLHVQLQHLTFNTDHMIVTLDKSKTDQHRDGHHVYIAQTNTEFCPIFHVRQFLALADLQPGRDVAAYLIPRLHKTKTGHLASKTKGISYSCIRDIFITKLRQLHHNPRRFGLHSLRSGGASGAAQNGVSDRLISKQGRWASKRARNGYIKDDTNTRVSVGLSLGL